MTSEMNTDVETDPLLSRLSLLRSNIERVFMGKPAAVEQVLIGVISRGHVLIEYLRHEGGRFRIQARSHLCQCGPGRRNQPHHPQDTISPSGGDE